MVDVVNYYANKSILITGATGFMGKVLLEKLLRSCPDLKVIYILIRKKKGQSADERLRNLLNCELFEKLLEMNPKVQDKIKLITGDIMEEGLGISTQDLEELQRECQIVFHNAACVSFNLPLKEAVNSNTIGTQKLLTIADTMKKLEVFVHISTSYCQDQHEVVEEKVYPAPHPPKKIIDLTSWMDDVTLAMLEKKIILPFPNTYGYSKCLSEQLVTDHGVTYPIAIARPSIVVPSLKDPVPGWVDNINGPNGIMYAACRGVLHTMYCKESSEADTVPVDIVINALIILGCLTALEKPKDIRVCNITQSGINTTTWTKASKIWTKLLKDYPLSYSLWYPVAKAKGCKYEQDFDAFFEHTLPAYVFDFLLFLFGQKTFMIRVNRRLKVGLDLLDYYIHKKWNFKNEYFQSLRNKITKKDNEIFFTDLEEVSVEDYMERYVQGIRRYYCKEDPSTLPKAKKLHQRLYILHIAMLVLLYSFYIFLFYKICNMLIYYVLKTEDGPFKEARKKEEGKGYLKVTHCLFDMDGTVLNSEIMYHQMIKKICSKYNKKYTKELQVKMYGVTDREICTTVVKELKMPISIDEMERQLSDLAQKLLPSAPLQEGAERLLTHLHDSKVPMALATNSTEQAVRLHATARPKLFGLFHHKVSVTDSEVLRGKPYPDIYLVAASRFPEKPKPKQCLVFEDSAVGVTSAIEAGMQVVMIPDRRIDREQTRQATIVIRSLLDFQPECFGLPPFDDTPRTCPRIEQ